MNQAIVVAVVEMAISLFIEGIILSFVFNWISDSAGEKQQKNLKSEMNNIETQNKFIFELIQKEIRDAKTEIISQIKESSNKG